MPIDWELRDLLGDPEGEQRALDDEARLEKLNKTLDSIFGEEIPTPSVPVRSSGRRPVLPGQLTADMLEDGNLFDELLANGLQKNSREFLSSGGLTIANGLIKTKADDGQAEWLAPQEFVKVLAEDLTNMMIRELKKR